METPTPQSKSEASRQASAEAWAEIGRAAARQAQIATSEAHFGTAETYRICAEQCFRFELILRGEGNKVHDSLAPVDTPIEA